MDTLLVAPTFRMNFRNYQFGIFGQQKMVQNGKKLSVINGFPRRSPGESIHRKFWRIGNFSFFVYWRVIGVN
jgi:hypothetical protein